MLLDGSGIIDHAFIVDRFERRDNGRHCEHPAAECGAEVVDLDIRRYRFVYQASTDGNAAAKRLSKRDDVGLNAVSIFAAGKEPAPRSADTCLHLIENKYYPAFVA